MKKYILAILFLFLFISLAYPATYWESDFDGHSSDFECCESDGDCSGACRSWDDLDLYSSIHSNQYGDNWGECNTQICNEADRSGGAGNNRGFRIYLDDRVHPCGENSLGFSVSNLTSFYIRWYNRFSFTPTGGYVKTFRMYGEGQKLIIDWLTHSGTCQLVMSISPFGGDRLSWDHRCSELPLDTWVCYEMFMDIPNQQCTLWVDGVNQGTDTDTAVNSSWYISTIEIGGNQYGFTELTPPNEQTMDYDDIIVSSSYIGPESGGDVTPPTLSTAVISANGTTLTLTFDEAVTQGSGYNDSDWDLDCSKAGNDIGITYSSGDGTTTHVYTIDETIQSGETVNIDFNGDSNSEEDGSGNDLGAIVNDSVTNNSIVSVGTCIIW